MKKFKLFLLTIISIFSLSSCMSNSISQLSRHDYDEVSYLAIDFNDIFTINYPYYFIYIYSLHCLHCELIKSKVITYALSNYIPMRFIEYNPSIPVLDDVSTTIGAKSVQNLGILGTPALLLIENYQVSINISGMDLIQNVLNEYK